MMGQNMNSIKRVKKLYRLLFLTGILAVFFSFASFGAAKDLTKKNLIYMAYDDSGSMYRDTDVQYDSADPRALDRWNQAKYALEVFSAMMLEKDEMYIFPLNEYGLAPDHSMEGAAGRYIHLLGSDSAQSRWQQIEAHDFYYGQHTPYHSVQYGYEALMANKDENTVPWLVILSDGAFDQDIGPNGETIGRTGRDGDQPPISAAELDDRFKAYAKDVNVVFLRIFDGSVDSGETPKARPKKGIHVFEAKQSSDTLKRLNEISNLIFKRQSLDAGNGQITKSGNGIDISLDAPVQQVVVFAQGQEISAGSLTGDGGVSASPAESILIGTPKPPTQLTGASSVKLEDLITAEGLGCTVATYDLSTAPIQGTFHVDVSDTSNLSVYVRPAVKPVVAVYQGGSDTPVEGALIEGEATVVLQWVNSVTGEPLEGNSLLLSDISYQDVRLNGEKWPGDGNSATVTLTAGTPLSVSGSVQIAHQSGYEIDSYEQDVRVEETIGELQLQGEQISDAKSTFQSLKDSGSCQAFSVSILENQAPIAADRCQGAHVDASAQDTEGLTFTSSYDSAANAWVITASASDAEALLGGAEQITIPVTVTANVATVDDAQSVEKTFELTLSNPGYVGTLEIAEVANILDGAALLTALASEDADKGCIQFKLKEDGAVVLPEEGATISPQVACTDDSGVSFTVSCDETTGLYTAQIVCSDLESLQYEGHTATIPYRITASIDRGDGLSEAEPVDGTLSFENTDHIDKLSISLDPAEGSVVYQDLYDGGEGIPQYRVSLMDGELALPAAKAENDIHLTPQFEEGAGMTMDAQYLEDNVWVLTPQLADTFKPDFEKGDMKLSFSVEASLDRGEGKEKVEAKAQSGSLTVTLEEAGIEVTFDSDLASYAMKDIAMTAESAPDQDPLIAVVTKNGAALSESEWANFEIVGDVFLANGKGEKLEKKGKKAGGKEKDKKDGEAEETDADHFALVWQRREDGTVLIWPYALRSDAVKFGTKKLHAAFEWTYTDHGITSAPQTDMGTLSVRGLPIWLLLLRWLLKYIWFIIPGLILLWILSRYVPRDYVKIFGRMYGFKMKKHSRASLDWKDRGMDKSNKDVYIEFKLDRATVLAFWKNIEWTVSPLNGKDVGIRVYKDGQISLTKESKENLKLYKDDTRSKPLVSWGVAKNSYLADLSEETTLAKKAAIHLLFLYHKINVQNKKTLDLRISM